MVNNILYYPCCSPRTHQLGVHFDFSVSLQMFDIIGSFSVNPTVYIRGPLYGPLLSSIHNAAHTALKGSI